MTNCPPPEGDNDDDDDNNDNNVQAPQGGNGGGDGGDGDGGTGEGGAGGEQVNAAPEGDQQGQQVRVVDPEYNPANYGAKKRANKRQAERDLLQEQILKSLQDNNTALDGDLGFKLDDEQVDYEMMAMVKKIKRNLNPIQQEYVLEELQVVVSRHVREARQADQYRMPPPPRPPSAAVGRPEDMLNLPPGPPGPAAAPVFENGFLNLG